MFICAKFCSDLRTFLGVNFSLEDLLHVICLTFHNSDKAMQVIFVNLVKHFFFRLV